VPVSWHLLADRRGPPWEPYCPGDWR